MVIVSFTTSQFEISVGCLELRSRGFLFVLKAWPGVDHLFFYLELGVDTPRRLAGIIILSTFGPCALDSPWFKLFTCGPQSQPIRSQSQILVATPPPLGQQLVFLYRSRLLLLRSAPVFIPSCRPRPPPSPAQDCASLYFSFLLVFSALQCSINDKLHAFAFCTGILSLLNRVQIRKAKFKVV